MDPERMVSEGAARAAVQGPAAGSADRVAPPTAPARPFPVAWVLLIALLTGALVGVSLAMISIFVPGALPAVGAG